MDIKMENVEIQQILDEIKKSIGQLDLNCTGAKKQFDAFDQREAMNAAMALNNNTVELSDLTGKLITLLNQEQESYGDISRPIFKSDSRVRMQQQFQRGKKKVDYTEK